jgi:membrane protein implicated in regulation of membrane protease activity
MEIDIYRFLFSPWFWFVLFVIFAIIEFISLNLYTIWFAISAIVMIPISGFTEMLSETMRFQLHIGLFLLIAILLLIFTRPFAVKKLAVGKEKTNVYDLVNKEAIVTKRISKFEKGEVKIKGQIWTAISEDSSEITEGTECVIIRFEGVKAVVKKNFDSMSEVDKPSKEN